MTCEHLKSTVTETRRVGASIYRRRLCGVCTQFFVSIETAPEGLKFPAAANAKAQARSRAASRLHDAKQTPWQGWTPPSRKNVDLY